MTSLGALVTGSTATCKPNLPHALPRRGAVQTAQCKNRKRPASVVRFANEDDQRQRPSWQTLPIKHVLESQQFDKVVNEKLAVAAKPMSC